MRILKLLCLMSLVGCSSQPSKSEALQMFAASSSAMASAQSRALTDAQQTGALPATAEYLLDFSGPCTLGGTLGVTGSYDASGTGDHAAFDMTVSFDACQEAQGQLDGELRWSSVADGTSFRASMTGGLDWDDNQGVSASCDFNLSIAVSETSVAYSGKLCGYELTELGVGN
jgi:hypothetical protein